VVKVVYATKLDKSLTKGFLLISAFIDRIFGLIGLLISSKLLVWGAVNIAQAFGVGTHTDQPVSVSGASYTTGLAGIWYQWIWLFTTPFYWIIGPIYRRLRYVTMADFFLERYGKSLAIFYSFLGMIYFSMNIGIMLKGSSLILVNNFVG